MAKDARNRRRTQVVMRQMQGRIILHTTLLPMLALAALTVSVTILCNKLIAQAATFEFELTHVEMLLISVVCLTSAMAGAILYVAFRFSNRVAGPSHRLIESLKQIQRGDLDLKVKLRDGDFLTEVADQLNKTIAALRETDATAPADPAAGHDLADEESGQPVSAGR